MKEQKTVRLPITVMLLLVATLSFGAVTGAFMYATGDAVIENGFTLQMVSHTEYRYSEPGQIVARLVDYQGSAIAVDNCTTTILYPDKSIFVNEALMSESTNITGDHYYQFTTPSGPEGVYEYQATCTWNGGARTQSVTNSFHLSSAFNQVLGNLTSIQSDLQSINNTLVTEISNLNSSLQTTIGAVNSSLYTQMSNVNTSLTNYINETFSSLNGSLGTEIENVLTEIDNLQTNINNQLACGGPDFTTSLDQGPSATWQDFGVSNVGHGIEISTNYPNTVLIDVEKATGAFAPPDVNQVSLFDENFTLIATSTGSPTYVFNENLPYAGTYYLLGHFGGGATLFRQANTTTTTSFSNALYTFEDGFACGATEATTCTGYVSTGAYFWNFNSVSMSLNQTTGEADMCQLIRDVNESIQTALAAEFSDLYIALDGNFSVITSNQEAINVTVESISSVLDAVNVTTVNTYDYLTGTLADNVQQILEDLGVMNATLNRVESATTEINATTQQILQNQQDEVYMTTFSG